MGLAILGGGLLVLSVPAPDLGALAWIALVPMLVAVADRRPAAAFGLGLTTGLGYATGVFAWIWEIEHVNLLNWAALALYLAAYVGVFALGVAVVRRRTGWPLVVLAPPLWVALEYARAHAGFLALPWMFVGHTQHATPTVLQLASLFGVYGISFVIVLVNALLADWLLSAGAHGRLAWPPPRRLRVATAVVAAVVVAVVAYGHAVLSRDRVPAATVRVALVQGNVTEPDRFEPAGRARTLARYAGLLQEVAAARPDLTVWPETAVPGDLKHDPELRRRVVPLARVTGGFHLIGSSELAKFSDRRLNKDSRYNSMFLVAPSGELAGEYRKKVLVPFGEYVPLATVVRWPGVIAPSTGNHVAGDAFTVFSAAGRRFASVICWEVVFTDLVREFVRGGAEFLVVASNESWFGASAVPRQMLAMAAFRAVEYGVPVIKVANTGVSAIIDAHGRVVRTLTDGSRRELFVSGTLVHDVPVGPQPTLYAAWGDAFAWSQIALAGLLGLGAARPASSRRRGVRAVELPA